MRPIELTLSGLHSYRDAVHIDFEHLGEHGVFGIFGSIGSGKSSLLDGITLALYGIVDRVAGRSRQGIVNHHSKKIEVRLRFAVSPGGESEVYEVHRVYRRTKQGGAERVNSRLARIDGDLDEVIADKEREVNDRIEALLGLNATDFMRAVVLPQGRFMRFLHLKGTDRRAMLQRIFRLGAYGEGLRKQIKARREKLSLAIEGRRGQISGIGDASRQAIAEALAEAERADAVLSETTDDFEAIDAAWQAARAIRERQQRLAAAHSRLTEHLSQEDEVRRRADALERAERAASLEGPWDRLQTARTAAESAAAEAGRTRQAAAEAASARDQAAARQLRVRADQLAAEPHLREREHALETAVELATALEAESAARTAAARDHERAAEASARATAELEALEAAASELARERQALTTELAECQVPREQRETLAAIARAHDRIQGLTAQRSAVEARLATVRLRLEQGSRAHAHASQACAHAVQRRAALEQDLAETEPIADIDWAPITASVREWVQAHAAHAHASAHGQRATADLLAARAQAGWATQVRASAREGCTRIEAQLQAAEAAWIGLQRQNAAAVLADELRPGEPCAVCGSPEHPSPAAKVDLDDAPVQILQAASERARAWRDAAAELAAVAESRLEHTQRAASELERAQRSALEALEAAESRARALLPDDLAWLDGAGAVSDALEAHQAAHREAVERRRSELADLRERLAQARVEEERSATPVAAAEAALGAAREQAAGIEAELVSLREDEGAAWVAFDAVRGANTLFDVKRLQADQDRRDRTSQRLLPQLNALQARDSSLGDDLVAARAAAASTSGEHSALTDQLRTADARIADLGARLGNLCPEGSPAQALADTRGRRIALDQALADATDQAERTRDQATATERQASEAAAELKSCLAQRAAAQAELDRTLQAAGLDADRDLAPILASAMPAAARASERAWLDGWERERIARQAQVQTAEAELAGEGVDVRAFETLDARRNKAQIHLDIARTASLRAEHHRDDLLARAERYAALQTEVAALESQLARVDQLARLTRGDRFVDFLANDHLAELVREANRHLGRLTDGRYTLVLGDDAAFEIRDADGGGAVRPVHTLSGGETFVASLALALALSTQVQARSQNPLEFFFLDEGFGSLDADSLDRVMGAIEALREDARTIGLISHVPEVRERVPRYVEVSGPGRDGTTGSTVAVKDN